MQKFLILLILFCNVVYSQHNKKDVVKYQKQLNKSYFNKETTPLNTNELKKFKGLKFYPYNKKFVIKATLKRLENQPIFNMPTSGNLKPEYKRFGILFFEIDKKKFQLEVYQNQSLIHKKGFQNHLFLPFIDLTSGKETFGAGRYLGIMYLETNEIIIDFNKAYHPYCAYTTGYSCPITPDVNFLAIEILAGIKF